MVGCYNNVLKGVCALSGTAIADIHKLSVYSQKHSIEAD
jgi:hypothetical protein